MIMKTIKKILFGLSAYIPLFFVFMILEMLEPNDTFRHVIVGAIIFIIVISMVFFIMNVIDLNNMENTTVMKITDYAFSSKVSIVLDRPIYFIPYFSAIVLLFYRPGCMTKEVDVRVTIAVSVFVVFNILLAIALIISLELYAMNPMLYLCGYHFFDTDVIYYSVNQSKKNTSIMLISTDSPDKFECIQAKNIIDRTYVSFGRTEPKES